MHKPPTFVCHSNWLQQVCKLSYNLIFEIEKKLEFEVLTFMYVRWLKMSYVFLWGWGWGGGGGHLEGSHLGCRNHLRLNIKTLKCRFSLHNSNKNYVTALSNFEIFKRKALKSIFLTENETVKLFLLLQFSKDCS